MNLLTKASLSFKRLKVAEKPAFGANVITCLTPLLAKKNKLTATGLPVPVDQLQAFNDALSAAIAAALTGNHTARLAVKTAVAEWDNAFTLTANYISEIAGGDAVVIRQSGFVPTKSERTPAQKPQAPGSFNATINGSKGAIIAGAKKVPNAKVNVFSAVPAEAIVGYNGNTMHITIGGKTIYIMVNTQKQTEFCNLPSSTPFNVSMFSVNSAGSGPAVTAQQVTTQ